MRRSRASAGFSLIELMIALAIGLVVLTVLATVFARTSSGRGDLERVTRLVENSRFAADLIGDDVRHSGFYGTFMPPSDALFTDPSPCSWNTADVTQLGWQPGTVPPRYPAQMQGWDDPGSAVVALNCLPNRVAGTDVLAIRRASSRNVTPAQVVATSVYVQASQCINDTVPLRVTNDSALFTLRTAACNVANLAAIRRYFVRVYYVASCNECAPSDGIRTLKRMEVVDNVYRVVSLAEGVENCNSSTRSTPTTTARRKSCVPTSRAVGPAASWSNVVAVRMHLLMRSTEPGMSATRRRPASTSGPATAAWPVPTASSAAC